MHAAPRSSALLFAWWLGACMPPPLQDCSDSGCTSPLPGTTDGPPVPTTGGGDAIQTVTGEDEETTAADTTASSGGSTAVAPAEEPEILGVEVDPNPITDNGLITVDVATQHAAGVRMKLDTGEVVELVSVGAGTFEGQIPAFTGLDNGMHTAVLTPWDGAVDGRTADALYTIDLPEPGSQGFWETGDLVGGGNVAALGVLPDGMIVEFGTYFENGEPRCYLRRRDQGGAWFAEDFVSVLPTSYCSAIDMKIDPEFGTLHVLVYRKGGDGLRWWLGDIAAWGKGAKNIGLGAVGDKAEALARGPGVLAVCGSQKAPTLDLDAAVWLYRPDQPANLLLFDYLPTMEGFAHRFDETARDCVFAGDDLVLAGEALGVHSSDPNEPERARLMVIEYETDTDVATWTVANPGPGVQSRAMAIDVDDQGRYILAGYTCGDACEPDGEIRIYLPGGGLEWQAPLGPLQSDWAGPHDVAWSPAGYIVVALAEVSGQDLLFKVQAFAPHVYEPLWTFLPKDMQGLQVALALAIGKYGEIYAGGIGAGNYPAVAFIPG